MKNIKTLTIAACLIILCPALIFAQTQTAYNPGKDPKYNLGQGSNVNADLNLRIGTNGAHIYIGTQTCNGVGTQGVVVGSGSTAPQIEITYGAGSTTFNLKNMNVKVDGSAVASTGNTIAATSGSGSDTTLINPSLAGTGDMASDFSINANGANISDDELSFLNALYGNVQNQLDAKVGSSTPRVAVIECGGTNTAIVAGSTTVKFQGGGDLTSTMTDDGAGHFTITTSVTGTPTAKPDVKDGTSTAVTGATTFNFGAANFVITPDGVGGANIDLNSSFGHSGDFVKCSISGTTSVIGSLGTIPDDGTLPENTEGTEVFTVTHTPMNANNLLFVEAVANVSDGGVADYACIAAIFKNNGTETIGANRAMGGASSGNNADRIISVAVPPFVAGTTTPFTFRLRCGVGGGTGRLNASALDGLTRFPGAWYSYLKVTEIKP